MERAGRGSQPLYASGTNTEKPDEMPSPLWQGFLQNMLQRKNAAPGAPRLQI